MRGDLMWERLHVSRLYGLHVSRSRERRLGEEGRENGVSAGWRGVLGWVL